jgi:hypothetical protein
MSHHKMFGNIKKYNDAFIFLKLKEGRNDYHSNKRVWRKRWINIMNLGQVKRNYH